MTQNCVITARGETVEATSIGWVKDGISAHVRWLHAGQQAPLIHDSYKMSLTCTHMDVDTDRQTWMPTYTHTRHSHRHTQLQVHPHRRFLSLPRTHSYVRADGLTFEPSAWHGVCQMALRGQRTGMKCGEGRRGGVGWKIGLFPSRPIFFAVFFFFLGEHRQTCAHTDWITTQQDTSEVQSGREPLLNVVSVRGPRVDTSLVSTSHHGYGVLGMLPNTRAAFYTCQQEAIYEYFNIEESG